MPIIKSAKKALRGSKRKQAYNLRRVKAMKETVKEVKKLIAQKTKESRAEAEKMLPKVYQTIDKAAKRGVIKKNTAARKKSRIVKMIKKVV